MFYRFKNLLIICFLGSFTFCAPDDTRLLTLNRVLPVPILDTTSNDSSHIDTLILLPIILNPDSIFTLDSVRFIPEPNDVTTGEFFVTVDTEELNNVLRDTVLSIGCRNESRATTPWIHSYTSSQNKFTFINKRVQGFHPNPLNFRFFIEYKVSGQKKGTQFGITYP